MDNNQVTFSFHDYSVHLKIEDSGELLVQVSNDAGLDFGTDCSDCETCTTDKWVRFRKSEEGVRETFRRVFRNASEDFFKERLLGVYDSETEFTKEWYTKKYTEEEKTSYPELLDCVDWEKALQKQKDEMVYEFLRVGDKVAVFYDPDQELKEGK